MSAEDVYYRCSTCRGSGTGEDLYLVEMATENPRVARWGVVHKDCILGGSHVRQFQARLVGTVAVVDRWEAELVPPFNKRPADWSPST